MTGLAKVAHTNRISGYIGMNDHESALHTVSSHRVDIFGRNWHIGTHQICIQQVQIMKNPLKTTFGLISGRFTDMLTDYPYWWRWATYLFQVIKAIFTLAEIKESNGWNYCHWKSSFFHPHVWIWCGIQFVSKICLLHSPSLIWVTYASTLVLPNLVDTSKLNWIKNPRCSGQRKV